MKPGDALIFAFIALLLWVAVAAIKRGRTSMKAIKTTEISDKKVKIGYWLASLLHMSAGIIIAFILLCFIIINIVIFFNNQGG